MYKKKLQKDPSSKHSTDIENIEEEDLENPPHEKTTNTSSSQPSLHENIQENEVVDNLPNNISSEESTVHFSNLSQSKSTPPNTPPSHTQILLQQTISSLHDSHTTVQLQEQQLLQGFIPDDILNISSKYIASTVYSNHDNNNVTVIWFHEEQKYIPCVKGEGTIQNPKEYSSNMDEWKFSRMTNENIKNYICCSWIGG